MKLGYQKYGGLEFLYNSKIIEYENLTEFIKTEFIKNKQENEKLNEEIIELNNNLEKLRIIQEEKEEEYHIRQKQVAMYLECKKSFLGKIRYYFKGKKNIKESKKKINLELKEEKTLKETEDIIYDMKEYYTIEDLINITKLLDRVETQIRNVNLDIKALEDAIERLSKKIENAKKYIEEIEEHKKSIFEFWKFVNKDKILRIK